MKKFLIRTAFATVYAVLFIGSMLAGRLTGNLDLGFAAIWAFSTFVALGCTYEFYKMVSLQGARPFRGFGYVCVLSVMLLSALYWIPYSISFNVDIYGLMALLTAVICFLLFPLALLLQLWRPSEQPFRDAAYTILPLLYIGVPMALMPALNTWRYDILLLVVVLVWICDSCAYMGGSLLGRHVMWQRHSPGKTWEGTAIGVACCMVAAVFLGPLLSSQVVCEWPLWLLLGLVCGVFGTLGDLVESMLKRSVGVKDSGTIMPGHGGFLDRFDSLLIVLPVVACYMLLIFG